MDYGRKRGNPDGSFTSNGGIKRSKQERDSFATGIGSKSKPCTKFFSTSGCSFGEECHFLHYVPGGYSAVSQMTNMGGNHHIPSGRNPMAPPPFADGPAPTVKSKLCNKFNTAEGCKFGNKCRFAHGEMELGRPSYPPHEDPRGMGPMMNRFPGRSDPPQHGLAAAANFGASATAKISIDASLAGAVIGKGGVNSKQICRATGVKLAIKEHDTDPNQRNIELEGTFDQIKQASAMVGELIMNVGAAHHHPPPAKPSLAAAPANNFKTKVCEHFTKGSCTFGERCHFAHGDGELRKSGV
ncbi:zinc finger CCCH domain-containing protein 14-like [Rhododendron vialii]|uniref:zinc finger CCCH domain-containing protein 14-like n=1 Tax=Rhododendron vialii TaxID=182163 RepID=UPI00265E55B5|nr:zinc finger CCCH domain-containing protein 14-like [Rhododendron vialii]